MLKGKKNSLQFTKNALHHSNTCVTCARNLSHFNEDGFTELAKFNENLHPAADVYFIFFS